MATEKYPHEIAIEDTVGNDLSKLPGDLRRRISGFNISKSRTTDEDMLLKQSHVLANDILDWDEKDLPDEPEDAQPQGAQGQQSQSQNTDTPPAAGNATDSNTQGSTQEPNTEGKKDDTPQTTDSSTQTKDEPEFIQVPRVAPFGRVKYDTVKNPNYKPKS